MPEEIIFPEKVEVGKFYSVPHVRVNSHSMYSHSKEGAYVPINTHLHDDKKVLKFHHKHWHIDWRFVNERLWKSIIESKVKMFNLESKGKRETANIVILETEDSGVMGVTQFNNSTDNDKIYYRKVKCKRLYSASDFFDKDIFNQDINSFVFELPKVFCNTQLKVVGDKLICPHKGVHIDKNCKDRDGNYICPAHLLRFDPVTLKVIQNIKPEQKALTNN